MSEKSYHLFAEDSVERGAIFASITASDLLQEGKNNSSVHCLVSDGQVDSIGLSDVVDGVSDGFGIESNGKGRRGGQKEDIKNGKEEGDGNRGGKKKKW